MKWPGVFLIGAVVFFLSWGELRAADKYSPRQRFGYGYSSTEPLANFDYASLRAGWFFNWSDTLPNEIYVPVGMDYFGLVGGYSKTNFPADINDTECVALRQKIQAKPALYPEKMSWLVGNEIGWDDQRTSDEYAEAFVAWFDCLKSINATFKVGNRSLDVAPALFTQIRRAGSLLV